MSERSVKDSFPQLPGRVKKRGMKWQGVYLKEEVWERDKDTDGLSVGEIGAVAGAMQGMRA